MSSRILTSVAACAMLAGASAFVSATVPDLGAVTAARAQSAPAPGANSNSSDAVMPATPPSKAPSGGTMSAAPGAGGAFITTQAQGDLSANRYIGHSVKNGQGNSVGDINDLIFQKDGGIKAAVVGVGGFLGIGEKDVAVAFDKISVSEDPQTGDLALTTDLTKDQLKSAPEFKTREAQLSEQQDKTTTSSTPMSTNPSTSPSSPSKTAPSGNQ